MVISLKETKEYLRISHNQDDEYINNLIEVAKSFICEQTGVSYVEQDKVYSQGILFMVAHLYDNRSAIYEKTTYTVPFTLESILIHLKIRGQYEQRQV